MYSKHFILALPLLLASVSALPMITARCDDAAPAAAEVVTPEAVVSEQSRATASSSSILKAVLSAAPGAASCAGAPFPDECRTADQAAPHISNAFSKYGITTPAEQAALIALMLYESGEFKYNKNHFPGVPGQGTRNMQSPTFNSKYATDLFGAQAVTQAGSPTAVLNLVLGDAESFASAAWFVTTQCSATFRQGLQAGTQQGWESYLTNCIGTTVNADRNAYWTKTVAALASA